MILADLFSVLLRLAELAFVAIVAGLTGAYLQWVSDASTWDQGRFIYTEVVAGLAMILAIIWLFPFSGSFIHYPVDFLICILWFIAFGLIVNWLDGGCGYIFNWDGASFTGTNSCGEWKANIAFCFLSAIVWLVSAILGVYWVHRHDAPAASSTRRRRWYRSRV